MYTWIRFFNFNFVWTIHRHLYFVWYLLFDNNCECEIKALIYLSSSSFATKYGTLGVWDPLTWVFFLNMYVIRFRHINWIWLIHRHFYFVWNLFYDFVWFRHWHFHFHGVWNMLRNDWITYTLVKSSILRWNLNWKWSKTDLHHFVRLRNWYFHFVWNLAAREYSMMSLFFVVAHKKSWFAILRLRIPVGSKQRLYCVVFFLRTFLMTSYGFGTWIFTS